MSARSYACPSCGAHVDEQARHCRYCRAPVATVRCASCFHMSVPDAGFCSGCGQQLGLEPVGEIGELHCPLCHDALDVYPDGAGFLYDCGLCGGQFIEHPRLHDLLAHHERPQLLETHAKLDAHAKASGRPDPRTGYLPCPACASLMNRKNFGGSSGVIVDVCKKHGTWFDLGELPRVLAFVEAGGLERSRRREAAEQEQLRHTAAAVSMTIRSPDDVHLSFESPASLARSFLDMLLR